MSYRTKKDVLSNISTRRKRRNGVEYTTHDAYLGYAPYTGKQVRMQSSDLAELKARIERFYVEYRAGGDAATRKTLEKDCLTFCRTIRLRIERVSVTFWN